MHLMKVDLSHEILLKEKFQLLQLDIAEYSFANVYLFRHVHDYHLFFKNELFLKGITRDGFSFLMPTFPLYKASIEHLREWLSEVDFFFPIPEEWKDLLDPQVFQSTFLEQDSDYLFNVEKMRTYAGRHLNGKRNLVRQFLSAHTVQAFPLTQERAGEAMSVLDKWRQELEPDAKTDYEPCKEALSLISQLQLTGLIFYVDEQPAAFVLGEKLYKAYAIHFAKAQKSIKGLYQYIFQAFANSLNGSVELINMEQDLGSPQVHQAKHSYHPDRMLHKWRIISSQ